MATVREVDAAIDTAIERLMSAGAPFECNFETIGGQKLRVFTHAGVLGQWYERWKSFPAATVFIVHEEERYTYEATSVMSF